MLRGWAAAHQLMVDQDGADMAYADELAAQILDEQYRSSPAATPPISPVAPAPHQSTETHAVPASLPVAEEEQLFDPDFMAVTDRMLKGKANIMTEEIKTQMRGVATLVVEATGMTDIRALRQGHVTRFIEMRRPTRGHCRSDIIEVDGIWCFDIEDIDNRGVKTESSPRLVPIHSHLLELGLMWYRNEVVR